MRPASVGVCPAPSALASALPLPAADKPRPRRVRPKNIYERTARRRTGLRSTSRTLPARSHRPCACRRRTSRARGAVVRRTPMNERAAPESGSVQRRASSRRPRIGLALAGGGPLGAIYEIGALAALSEALDGIDFNDIDVYVGVSAGGFIAAGLANGITPHQMSRLFIEGERTSDRFAPSMLLGAAFREYAKRLASVPPLALSAAWHYLLGTSTIMSAFERLGRAIPTGVFSGDEVDRYLANVFSQPGRSNDFRRLPHPLHLPAP